MSEEILKLPKEEKRVETGPIQFGEDWPGTFIRGDNAFAYSVSLAKVLSHLPETLDTMVCRSLLRTLLSSNLNIKLVEELVEIAHAENLAT